VFKVVAVWDGKKSEPLPFRRIEDAKAEAQTCSRHLAQSAIVYAPGEPKPRCIYERGELVVCRCPEA
jgi:hypothetical protein